MQRPEIHVLLHNIRSAHNVGAIFRTSDAIGVARIVLSGYTPLPSDKFGRPSKEITKTALGSERSNSWNYVRDPVASIARMQREGFSVIAIEQDARAIDYKEYRSDSTKVLLLVGNEVRGLSAQMRRRADAIVEIPMRGRKESLNVSVAYGIALFGMFDRS
jgi:tRNA G18 (ribose-2'-O)-methylase SpoU